MQSGVSEDYINVLIESIFVWEIKRKEDGIESKVTEWELIDSFRQIKCIHGCTHVNLEYMNTLLNVQLVLLDKSSPFHGEEKRKMFSFSHSKSKCIKIAFGCSFSIIQVHTIWISNHQMPIRSN